MKIFIITLIVLQSCTINAIGQVKYFIIKPITKFNVLVNSPNVDFLKLRNPKLLPRVNALPANIYVTCLKSICKAEYQFQKSTKIPLYFRLGSLGYTNYLEGKNKGYLLR